MAKLTVFQSKQNHSWYVSNGSFTLELEERNFDDLTYLLTGFEPAYTGENGIFSMFCHKDKTVTFQVKGTFHTFSVLLKGWEHPCMWENPAEVLAERIFKIRQAFKDSIIEYTAEI